MSGSSPATARATSTRIIGPPRHRQRCRVRPVRAAIAPVVEVDQPPADTHLIQRPVQRVVHTETTVQHQHGKSLTDHLDVDPVDLHAAHPFPPNHVLSAQQSHFTSRPSENNADTTRWSRPGSPGRCSRETTVAFTVGEGRGVLRGRVAGPATSLGHLTDGLTRRRRLVICCCSSWR